MTKHVETEEGKPLCGAEAEGAFLVEWAFDANCEHCLRFIVAREVEDEQWN